MSSDFKDRRRKTGVGFRFAWNGIKEVYQSERNFRIHLSVALLVTLAAFVFGLSKGEWVTILLIMVIVFSLEMVNTAMERLLDFYHPEQHPVIGSIKDITAGAVLVASIGSVIIGMIIFLPKLFMI
ncbi:diacylglycerol kinase family protein [Halobacillus sp. Nhm2S1]|uniref:diacylglycerol kinase family protein n=1 Tax=Halobacillus sp. Nhm2S1 TaxID=2866716 RepID=UPI001C72B691|nr:diacylglycerol kinase family protein [Halobacillus sp. Nhm2S1]MBX0358756.1 diacylglycerol kinase family protein [Halobacillus sp. Nhm2S1]